VKRLLLDTHVLIWWFEGSAQLGVVARQEIGEVQNEVFVSAATIWEMAIKKQLGKLEAPDDLEQKVEQAGFSKLDISLFHGEQAGLLPLHHKDPFDRMLVAQAQAEGLVLVTKDEVFPNYGIKLMNALA
jgi:PIN domain nuclease of toxin-antitoxin system